MHVARARGAKRSTVRLIAVKEKVGHTSAAICQAIGASRCASAVVAVATRRFQVAFMRRVEAADCYLVHKRP